MGRRRQGREIALQALYIVDTSKIPETEAFAIVNRRGDAIDEKTLLFARDLLAGTLECRGEIDGRIEAAAENWTLPRMAAVDRNVLRLASYELLMRPDTPAHVVIDEAIEIVRKYSTEEATRFVNGILDRIMREARATHGDVENP